MLLGPSRRRRTSPASRVPRRSAHLKQDPKLVMEVAHSVSVRLASLAQAGWRSRAPADARERFCTNGEKRPDSDAQHGSLAQPNHTRAPSVEGPSAGRPTLRGAFDSKRFGGSPSGKSRVNWRFRQSTRNQVFRYFLRQVARRGSQRLRLFSLPEQEQSPDSTWPVAVRIESNPNDTKEY